MARRFVSTATAQFHPQATGGARDFILIYGDEVDTTGTEQNGRSQVVYRARTGWVLTSHLGADHPAELYFIDVGQGDAAFIVTPQGRTILVDGGRGDEAFQFLVWRYRLDLLLTRYDAIQDLDRSQLTSTLQAWFDAVSGEPGLTCEAVDATSAPISVGDPAVSLHVLGPRLVSHPQGPAYPWLDSSVAKTVNGHSVVLRLDIGAVRILLPGDLNESGARYLMQDVAFTTSLGAHVLKAPHHGSHDFHVPFLGAVRPQISVVSSGESPSYGHPRANFMAATGRASRSDEPLLFSTELVAQFSPDPQTTPLGTPEPVDPSNAALLTNARQRFKKNLNGLINVRTDGSRLFAARRVNAAFQFETYGPSPAAP